MKTADGIRKGLEVCPSHNDCTGICPYEGTNMCRRFLMKDALAYIQQLESLLAQAERERDAAVTDLYEAIADEPYKDCLYCKDKEKTQCDECFWQWRVVCPENSKEEN